MICKVCGAENEEGLAFCTSCGAELTADEIYAEDAPVAEYKDTLGIISLICSILGLLCCSFGGIFSIAAIVLGAISKKKAAEAGAESKLGKVGLIIGIVALVLGTVVGIVGGIAGGLAGGLLGGAASSMMYY